MGSWVAAWRVNHARDAVLVVWSEEEAYYLHCLSLSHKQLPEVTFSIAESGA